jgi:hypothetical protein
MAAGALAQTLHKGRITVFSRQALIKAPQTTILWGQPINIGNHFKG